MAKNWAICIGINEYAHLTPLRYARDDARQMYDFFKAEKFDRALLFCDHTGNPRTYPSCNNLWHVIENIKHEAANVEVDNFWFFYSGHGMRYNGKDYLMPIDSLPLSPSAENLDRCAIAVDFAIDNLRASGADNVILFLDACRNEKKDGEGIGRQTREKVKETGIICFFSCRPNEYSHEIAIEGQGTGAFTHALQEGLSEQQKCASVERLSEYVRLRVPELLRDYRSANERQTPETIANPDYKSRLLLLPKYATPVDLAALKNDAYKASWLEPDLELAERLWNRVLDAAYTCGMQDKDAIKALQKIALLREQPLQTFQFEVVAVNNKGEITRHENKQARYFREDCNGIRLEMVAIPGGSFMMGSPQGEGDDDEKPQHQVTIPPFYMGKTAITQAQWQAVAALPKIQIDLKPDPSRFKGANRPVEQISWWEAEEFCKRLSKKTGKQYRLPSEAEWEYACRAGTTTTFHFGETITPELVNYNGNYPYGNAPKGEYRGQTVEVGTLPPNGYGLYEMHGNVWEWCGDHWHENYKGAPSDGVIWPSSNINSARLLRGGAWSYNSNYCRSAYRDSSSLSNFNYDIGFRVVALVQGLL